MNRIERIFEILNLIEKKDLSVKEIALKLKADDSTIYRDIELLEKIKKVRVYHWKVKIISKVQCKLK